MKLRNESKFNPAFTPLESSALKDASSQTGHIRKTFSNVTGFTLIETVTVVVILGILVSLGVPVYNRAAERARDKEAITNLLLIQAAEKIYKAENGFNYPNAKFGDVDLVADINTNLHLNLNENEWDYRITTDFWVWFAWARRNASGFDRTYSINETATAPPTCSGACP